MIISVAYPENKNSVPSIGNMNKIFPRTESLFLFPYFSSKEVLLILGMSPECLLRNYGGPTIREDWNEKILGLWNSFVLPYLGLSLKHLLVTKSSDQVSYRYCFDITSRASTVALFVGLPH